MKAKKVSDFLGTTSDKFNDSLFSISIVNYDHVVSEDWHFHENIHVSAILAGGNRESRKAEDIQVKPGKIMSYREGEIHRNRFTAFPSKNLNIEFGSGFFKDDIQFDNLESNHGAYLSLLNIYRESTLDDRYSQQSIHQILESLFYQGKSVTKPNWIVTVQNLLNDRWQEFISLQELSSELGLHPVSISKYFAKYENCTLADYMRQIKIERATHLLFNTAWSLTEIAHYCGFSDQSHMGRLFRLYTGFSPKELRALA
nr:AraC family transcriptional regulator [Allomuricauda sp.]